MIIALFAILNHLFDYVTAKKGILVQNVPPTNLFLFPAKELLATRY